MPRLDPSPWNLGVPLGALASACGPVIPLEPDGPTSIGDHEPTTSTSATAESTGYDAPCNPPCALGYYCAAPDVCIPYYGGDDACGENPCCNGDPYDNYGCYGCVNVGDCGSGSFCGDDSMCHAIVIPPPCRLPPAYVEVLGPTPDGIAGVFSLAFAELDGFEGRELVIGHQSGAMLMPGPGEPAQVLPLPYDALVEDIVSGDFDGDGDIDLVMSITPQAGVPTIVIERNEGGNVFSVVDTGETAFDPAVGDVDGDGLPDLAVALPSGPDTRSLVVLPNAGGLSIGDPTLLDIDSIPLDIDVGDLDGDGLADVVGVDNLEQNLWYGADPIDGVPDWTGTDVPSYLVQTVIGDFDGDGRDDLARLTNVNGWTLVDGFASTGDGLVAMPEWGLPGDTSYAAVAGDLDADGRVELVRSYGQQIEVRHGGPQGELFGCLSTWAVPIVPYRMVVGDFTGDGFGDVAISDGGSVQVYVVAAVAPP
jgi:hypothetical protein